MTFNSPMKNFLPFRFLAAAGLLLGTAACEKVVTLDLNNTDPQLSIEGNLADDGHPATVQLSRSVAYTETNTFPAVRGAVVTLSDDAGGLETLAETSTPGLYQGRTLLGQPGRRYTLRVETGGQAYVAAATLPAPVPLTGLSALKAGFSSDDIQLVPEFLDPAGQPNYYLFRQYRNGRLNKTLFLRNDEFTDGKPNSRGLGGRGSSDAEEDQVASGDSVRVVMQNLDADVYEYFRTLNEAMQGNSASPANPRSNFTGGVLGYFSAHSKRQRSLIVPPL